MLGPTFHMENRQKKTLSDFHHVLRQEWDITNMVIGGDEEPGLRRSAREQWPDMLELLCTLHLEDNTKRALTEKNVPADDKGRLVWKIYNKKDGLIASKDEEEFRKRALGISELAYTHMPDRWEELQTKIWKHVVVPRIVCPNIPIGWKNNPAESLNHVIKEWFDYNPQRMPQMMKIINDIYELQEKQIKAAFYGEGDFELDPSIRHKFALTKDHWVNLGPDGQKDHFEDFIDYKPAIKSATITDREQLIELSSAVSATKGKPNARKRARNDRTKAKIHPGTPLSKQSNAKFISGVDEMFMKDITTKYQKSSGTDETATTEANTEKNPKAPSNYDPNDPSNYTSTNNEDSSANGIDFDVTANDGDNSGSNLNEANLQPKSGSNSTGQVPKSPSAMTDQELSSLGIKGLIAAIKNKGGKPGLARSSKPKLIEKLKSLFKK